MRFVIILGVVVLILALALAGWAYLGDGALKLALPAHFV